jgi:hypothetical protein
MTLTSLNHAAMMPSGPLSQRLPTTHRDPGVSSRTEREANQPCRLEERRTCSWASVTPAAMDTMSVSGIRLGCTSCSTARTTVGFTATNSTSHARATSTLDEVVAMPCSVFKIQYQRRL